MYNYNNNMDNIHNINNKNNNSEPYGGFLPQNGRFQLAQAYVPYQKFERLYNPAQALTAGTIFEALDMPYTKRK